MDVDQLNELESSLNKIYEYLHTALVAELMAQGHSNTGKLIDSIKSEIVRSTDFIRLDGTFAFYGRFVDTGRTAGVRRIPIDVLVEWINQKGFESDAKKVRGMAFAIQKTIFEKGISQTTSWKGESTKDWMTKTLSENEKKIQDDVFNAVHNAMEVMIFNIVRDTNSQIQGNTVNLF